MWEKWSIFYVSLCFFGWGSSTFIMGFLGKRISIETAVMYQALGYCPLDSFKILKLLGSIIPCIFMYPRADYSFTSDHFLAILNGLCFVIADIAYYLVFIFKIVISFIVCSYQNTDLAFLHLDPSQVYTSLFQLHLEYWFFVNK
jgi:hypothetical protein